MKDPVASSWPARNPSRRRISLASTTNGSNVDTVMLAGKIRKWKGKLLDADLPKLRTELEASRDYLFNAAGVKRDLFRA